MNFNRELLRRRRDRFHELNVRIRFTGRRDWRVPRSVLREIEAAEEMTCNNTGMTLTIAFNYGGRVEIVDAVKQIVETTMPASSAPRRSRWIDRRAAVLPGHARPRSADPDQRRAAHLELPAVGGGVRGALVHAGVLARLRPRDISSRRSETSRNERGASVPSKRTEAPPSHLIRSGFQTRLSMYARAGIAAHAYITMNPTPGTSTPTYRVDEPAEQGVSHDQHHEDPEREESPPDRTEARRAATPP